MAQKKKAYTKGKESVAASASYDNALWISGFVLLIVGIFSLFSVISHFLHWSSDLSALRNDVALSGEVIPFENICNGAGARVAYWMVDCSFGVFGIILPIFITMLGWRIFRRKPLHLNHFALSAALLLIMGALTMGLVGLKWQLPYNVGGDLGHACATDLSNAIGGFGMLLVLIAGWILTGVFVNRNFMRVVNRWGDDIEKQGGMIIDVVKDQVVKGHKPVADDGSQPHEQEIVGSTAYESGQAGNEPAAKSAPNQQPGYVIEKPIDNQPSVVTLPSQPSQPSEPKEDDFTITSSAVRGENMNLNEYLGAQRKAAERRAEIGVDDDFIIEECGNAVQDDAVTTVLASYEDDDIVVVPNGVTPRKVDVDALLSSGSNSGIQSSVAEALDDELSVVPRTAQGSQPQNVDAVNNPSAVAIDDERDALVVKVRENRVKTIDEQDIDNTLYDPLKDLDSYKKPYVSLLEDYQSQNKVSDAEIYDNKCRIEQTLKNFGIPIVDINATVGPTVTLYEIVQAQGVKISKIQGLEKDIAQSLKALGIRIIAPIAGRGTIGIEVPNRNKQIVSMYSSICSEEFQHSKAELPIVIGRTIQNGNYTFDLAKMPHLLVAGATGQGKSVGLNAIITSLLYSKHPAELKFVLIDPKMVEFSVYNKLERHFLAKMESEDEAIVTDPKKAVYVLNSLVEEMGRRLELCKMATARNIVEYNEKFVGRRLNPQKGHRFLPYIVVIVDEFADLIMTAKEVEVPVMRLAQKARAVGIHLIIATQRPDVRVITGGIKANFPARIAFRVMQMIDSRTIIDQPGANQLIGRGDMLFSNNGELTRIQCALVETKEVERLVDYIAKQQGYTEAYPLPDYVPDAGGDGAMASDGESSAPVKYDSLFGEVARAAVTNGIISTSAIQRNYEVGFNRAGRIMMQLERAGIVGPQMGAKAREIKYYDLPSLEAKLQELGVF